MPPDWAVKRLLDRDESGKFSDAKKKPFYDQHRMPLPHYFLQQNQQNTGSQWVLSTHNSHSRFAPMNERFLMYSVEKLGVPIAFIFPQR